MDANFCRSGNMFARLSLLTVGLFVYATASGQYTLPANPAGNYVTPPSPDVWQFSKYGEYPVSRETGVPNISIPIHTINAGELSVPISLSYHAAGNKVDDIASWVGLGWTLNAGGVVSRAVKGRPDESGSGLLDPTFRIYQDQQGVIDLTKIDIGNEETFMNLMRMKDGIMDAEPDVFNFNYSGGSGKFFLDPSPDQTVIRRCISQPKSDMLIEASIANKEIKKIIIKSPDGTTFTFSDKTRFFGEGFSTVTSWYLTKIQSSNGAEEIDFFYKETQDELDQPLSETYSVKFPYPAYNSNPQIDPVRHSIPTGRYQGIKVLDRIEFTTGKVVFNSVATREDSYKTRLVSIDIYDNNNRNSPVKSFTLDNDHYFVSEGAPLPANNKRLKLLGLQEHGTNNQTIPPYEFSYLEDGDYKLPPRLSKAQDYWGYYNGQHGNQSLVPLLNYNYSITTSNGTATSFPIGNADRNPDAEKMKAGIISTIKYPTGGLTQFIFAANEISRTYVYTPPFNPEPDIRANIEPSTPVNFATYKEVRTTFSATKTGKGYVQFTLGSSSQFVHGSIFLTDNGGIVKSYANESASFNMPIDIIAGHTYVAYATALDHTSAHVTVSWSTPGEPQTVSENKTIGGLRIKNIMNYNANGTLLTQKFFKYTLPNNNNISSGKYNVEKLPSPEDYAVTTTYAYAIIEGDPGICIPAYDYDISSSSYPSNGLGFPAGNALTYEYVIETEEENGPRTIYQYDVSEKDAAIGFMGSFTLDRGWLRGQLLSESYQNLSRDDVRKVTYTYDKIPFDNVRIKGLKVGLTIRLYVGEIGGPPICWNEQGSTDPRNARLNRMFLRTYDEPITWKRLASKTETQDGVSKTTTFEYPASNIHTNIIATQTTDSKKNTERTLIRYAHEINNTDLRDKNMTGIPLESDVLVNGVVTSGSRLTYGTLSGLLAPIRFEQRYTNAHYKIESEIKVVNAKGKVEEFVGADGLTNSLKWDYFNQYPIARVTNAKATQIAFTSFENGESEGGWTYSFYSTDCAGTDACLTSCPNQTIDPSGYADCYYDCKGLYYNCLNNDTEAFADSKSGRKSFVGHAINHSISKTNLPLGNYMISFWAKKNGSEANPHIATGSFVQNIVNAEWQYYEFPLNAITGVTIGAHAVRIDDLRLYPVGSQMSTYTTNPSTGITSVSDANCATSYYSYDDFGRLETIKDLNKDILATYRYHYKAD
jgi:hypothetical protein